MRWSESRVHYDFVNSSRSHHVPWIRSTSSSAQQQWCLHYCLFRVSRYNKFIFWVPWHLTEGNVLYIRRNSWNLFCCYFYLFYCADLPEKDNNGEIIIVERLSLDATIKIWKKTNKYISTGCHNNTDAPPCDAFVEQQSIKCVGHWTKRQYSQSRYEYKMCPVAFSESGIFSLFPKIFILELDSIKYFH